MPKPTPITSQTHQDKYWQKPGNYKFVKDNSLIPLTMMDLARSVLEMPVALAGNDIYAILSLEKGSNLFVDDKGQWKGKYVPSTLKNYPFMMVKDQQNRLVLGVDQDSGLVGDKGKPFLDEEGQPTKQVKVIMDFLLEDGFGSDLIKSLN